MKFRVYSLEEDREALNKDLGTGEWEIDGMLVPPFILLKKPSKIAVVGGK